MKKFDIKELGDLKSVAHRTWQEIASDLSQLVGSPVSRDDVFEAVCDRLNDFADSSEERKVVKEFLAQDYEEMMELKCELFPFSSYE